MRKMRIIFGLTVVAMQSSFAQAQDMMSDDSKPCAAVASACLGAGFGRADTEGKKFWQDCMKPIMLGQSVQGVTIDPTVVKTCRTDKIEQLKKELNALEKVS